MDEDVLPDGLVDSMLYVDSLDEVPVPTPPVDGEGVTDGSTSTDYITPVTDDDVTITEYDNDLVEIGYTDVDIVGFEPVKTYHYDENGFFIIDEE